MNQSLYLIVLSSLKVISRLTECAPVWTGVFGGTGGRLDMKERGGYVKTGVSLEG